MMKPGRFQDQGGFFYKVRLEHLESNKTVQTMLVEEGLAEFQPGAAESLSNDDGHEEVDLDKALEKSDPDDDDDVAAVIVPSQIVSKEESSTVVEMSTDIREPLTRPNFPDGMPGATLLNEKFLQVLIGAIIGGGAGLGQDFAGTGFKHSTCFMILFTTVLRIFWFIRSSPYC